jgi:hypothetical protein
MWRVWFLQLPIPLFNEGKRTERYTQKFKQTLMILMKRNMRSMITMYIIKLPRVSYVL